MSDIVSLAEQRRADLINTVRDAEREIKELEAFLSMAGALSRKFGMKMETGSRKVTGFAASRSEKTDGLAALTVLKTAEILEQRGRPMHLGPLYDALVAAGVEIGGKEPKYNLSARLSNSGRFTSSRIEGWWFKDRPVPHRSAEMTVFLTELEATQGDEAPEKETAASASPGAAVPQSHKEDDNVATNNMT